MSPARPLQEARRRPRWRRMKPTWRQRLRQMNTGSQKARSTEMLQNMGDIGVSPTWAQPERHEVARKWPRDGSRLRATALMKVMWPPTRNWEAILGLIPAVGGANWAATRATRRFLRRLTNCFVLSENDVPRVSPPAFEQCVGDPSRGFAFSLARGLF